MTLPFRRRHHDAESGHDRARMLMSDGLLATLEPDDAAWLGRHLDGCVECGRDWKAFRADHRLLQGLRDTTPEPPRDLWARTSAALDREAEKRGAPAASRATREQGRGRGWRALPLGAGASVLVLAVVIGAQLIRTSPVPPASTAGGTLPVAVVPTPAPTGLNVTPAEPVAIFRETANGSWELVYKDVKEVCPPSNRNCVPKPANDGEAQPIDVGEAPNQIALSEGRLAIASDPTEGDPGRVIVVPVAGPGETPEPVVTDPPTSPPSSGESPSPPTSTPAPTPPGAIAIATDVRVIGDVAYSADGRWLAFSAAPADGSTGPDLYLWSPGQSAATAVTDDHRTYFSSWHHGAVLASRIEIPGEPTEPGASGDPSATAEPGATDKPGRGNQGGGKPRPSEAPTAAPTATAGVPDPSGAPDGSSAPSIEGHPISFLLDPETLERTDLTRSDVWLPVLNPSGNFVLYWSGTLWSEDGETWALGSGELVLDRWSAGTEPGASAPPESRGPSATARPSPSPSPVGPAGSQAIVVPGVKAAFEARFDPDGERLAIWVGEAPGERVGRLHLLVIDPDTGEVAEGSPLQGEPALRRFSIDKGLLAWVTPRGQDGRESIVQVLGWKGDDFGEIETEPGPDLYLP
jgi:hypothetical protein